MIDSLITIAVSAFVTSFSFYFGYKRGYHRACQYEPRKSIDLMEAENMMVAENARMLQLHMDCINKTLVPAMNAIECGVQKTMMDRAMLKEHVLRTFVDTCETIIDKHRYQIRSGPWTTEQARKFVGGVCDALWIRNLTINDAVEQIVERMYIEPPRGLNKVPIQRV